MALALTDNARFVLETRYLAKDAGGRVTETPEERLRAVAAHVAAAEGSANGEWAERFFGLMTRLEFLPNTPCLANAGRDTGQLAACFVLPIADSLTTPDGDGILDVARWTGLIHQTGGGTGFDFSGLRPRGAPVRVGGTASGPVSFVKLINDVTEAVKQGGIRRGANMAILRIDHPDVEGFIDAKSDEGALSNFNLSVAVPAGFMEELAVDGAWELRDPRDGAVVGRRSARELWSRIARAAWRVGDPGVVFLDAMNRDNPLAAEGRRITATNPCGEIPQLPWEACVLGSIDLARFARAGDVLDWARLETAIGIAVRFLDDVVTVNRSPVPAIERTTRLTRRIGLGVMGWADLLAGAGLAYDSDAGVALAERIGAFLRRVADDESHALATARGPYPWWRPEHGRPMRNVARLSVAPTGSISTIAGCSAGIEPYFSREVVRTLAIGEIRERYAAADLPHFRTALEIAPEWHVRHQAAWQAHIDNGVSKTVNLPNRATPEDVARVYERAFRLGCKGITVYRDGSRGLQVYQAGCPTCGGRMVAQEACTVCESCRDSACA